MGDLDGTTYLVTGANSGIGKAVARELAARGGRVFLAGRSESKTRAAIKEIIDRTGNTALHFLPLDLGSLSSVRACAEAFLANGEPLHALVNNAGVAGKRGVTDSGFELTFGTNYVGPFLLTNLLLERLRQSGPARIVNVASDAHFSAKGIDFEAVRRPTRSRTGLPEYSVSKLANVLHAQELARRLDGQGITTYSLHPGVIATNIWRGIPWPIRPLMKLPMRSPDDGAKTPVYCATAPELAAESGQYYEDAKRKDASATATPELGAELWERSEAWVGG
ncbi:MAG: SDR family oxidoreductase [Solirubrobacteraceae bacterium]|jgi:NAD(P)-dependent dehydrogenase (short-subunit alcohol dehydrogenase family)